jgi:hypothetical protein
MNHEPNTTKWKPGDIVIHDADAKSENMLMVVVGSTHTPGSERILTRYVKPNNMNGDKARRRPQTWENPFTHLHDPARFGIAARGGA